MSDRSGKLATDVARATSSSLAMAGQSYAPAGDVKSISFIALPAFPEIEPGADLAALVDCSVRSAHIVPRDGDILVVAQKIVSKAEGRIVDLARVTPSAEARQRLWVGVRSKDRMRAGCANAWED